MYFQPPVRKSYPRLKCKVSGLDSLRMVDIIDIHHTAGQRPSSPTSVEGSVDKNSFRVR
ncbi:hypothetical protein M501DRAFT_1003622 [Patellaria atrata CBS 101060]|uniref:Uncharacterized protein n=1 Tax=Patellaria atrata CBS 101060 TaxID=1346257 RepID=A0A9P4VSZ7_9PEZI|nr:hypothetical protein M501DRAFT_1003622 [Patellaria atrata CBS 101060]